MKTHYIELTGDDILREGDLRTSKGKRVFVEVIGVLNGQTVADRKPYGYDYYRPTPDFLRVRDSRVEEPEKEFWRHDQEIGWLCGSDWKTTDPHFFWLPRTGWEVAIGLDKLTTAGLILLPNRHEKKGEKVDDDERREIIRLSRELIDHVQGDDVKGRRLARMLRELVGFEEDDDA